MVAIFLILISIEIFCSTSNFSILTLQPPPQSKECPLDKEELGKSTWGFLHSMASYFPDKPTKLQSENMSRFFNIFAQFYPCEPCSLDFLDE